MKFLHENQYIPEELNVFIENNTSLNAYFDVERKSNKYRWKPKNYCGFLPINDESYFIAPKITSNDEQNLNIFIYML
ncbi:MAG TPA: hypothetical protein EYG94_00160, partial [Campylobacterales bacterium]|nr:hypothetical protein [Campylobacterales bacterium]